MSHAPLDHELARLGAPKDGLPVATAGDILARSSALTPLVVGLSGWKLGGALLAAGLLGGLGGAAVWQALSGPGAHDTVVLTQVVEQIVEVPVGVRVPGQAPPPIVRTVRVPSLCEHPSEPAEAAVAEAGHQEPEQEFDAAWLRELPSPEQRPAEPVEAPLVAEMAQPDLGRGPDQALRLRVGSRISRSPERPLGAEAAVEWVGYAEDRRLGTPWVSAGVELASGAGSSFESGAPLSAGLSFTGDRVGLEAGWSVTGSAARFATREVPAGREPGALAERIDWAPRLSTGPMIALRLGDEGRIRVGASGEISRDHLGEPALRAGLSLGMQTGILGGS